MLAVAWPKIAETATRLDVFERHRVGLLVAPYPMVGVSRLGDDEPDRRARFGIAASMDYLYQGVASLGAQILFHGFFREPDKAVTTLSLVGRLRWHASQLVELSVGLTFGPFWFYGVHDFGLGVALGLPIQVLIALADHVGLALGVNPWFGFEVGGLDPNLGVMVTF
jgi:hypothetical protein